MSKAVPDVLDELRFFQRPSSKKQRVLLLDYDGTIAPFHRERFRAVPYPVVPHLLHRIMTMCRTRLIVIGGRSAREMAGLLGMNPAAEIWGVYGLQYLDMNGFHREAEVNPDSLQSLATAEAGLEREGLTDLLEIKMAGVAVHWRGLDPAEILKARRKAYTILEPLTSNKDRVLAEFDEGVEIRLRVANKGIALSGLLAELDSDVPVAYLAMTALTRMHSVSERKRPHCSGQITIPVHSCADLAQTAR